MWRNIKLRHPEDSSKHQAPGFLYQLRRALLIGLGVGLLFKLLLIQFIRVTH
ncbi:MAG: hypothetical protein HQM02_10345 [Magnetococcales bacterium]|nr:hypothetical protein [Magnetococcales bacterium]